MQDTQAHGSGAGVQGSGMQDTQAHGSGTGVQGNGMQDMHPPPQTPAQGSGAGVQGNGMQDMQAQGTPTHGNGAQDMQAQGTPTHGNGVQDMQGYGSGVGVRGRGGDFPFYHPILGNVLPCVGRARWGCDSEEEEKLRGECRKILSLPALRVGVSCVRVPVERVHSIAIHAEFEQVVSLEAAREVLEACEAVRVVDEPALHVYPTPQGAAYQETCEVGRLRLDESFGPSSLAFFVCGDQLLRGAALNAFEIAEVWEF